MKFYVMEAFPDEGPAGSYDVLGQVEASNEEDAVKEGAQVYEKPAEDLLVDYAFVQAS